MRRLRSARVARCGAVSALLMATACADVEPTPIPIPRLTIGLVAPSYGFTTEPTSIQIHGSGFQPGVTVRIDGVPVTAVFESATKLIATAPPHELGSVEVVVTNLDGAIARLENAFTYVTTVALDGDLSIRPGESITTTLAYTSHYCTFESVPCRRLVVDAANTEMIELELTPIPSGRLIGLYEEEPFVVTDYPSRLTVRGGRRVFIMGQKTGFTVTAR